MWRKFCLILLMLLAAACRGPETAVPPFQLAEAPPVEAPPPGFQPSYHSRLVFENLGVEQGLSQSSITDVLQDRQGLMWIATQDGLNRFDGYNFTIFRHVTDDANSVGSNHVHVMYEDRWGNLWLGTRNAGLDRYDRATETFEHFPPNPADPRGLPHERVRAIAEDSEGTLWIGTMSGLSRLDRETGQFDNFWPAPGTNDFANYMLSIAPARDGTLWLGTAVGLYTFDPRTEQFEAYELDLPLGDPSVRHVEVARDGRLWLGAASGVHVLDPQSGTLRSYMTQGDWTSGVARDLAADAHGGMWAATTNGLMLVDPERGVLRHYQHDPRRADSLADNNVSSVFVDEAGVVWIGTETAGVDRFDPLRMKFDLIEADLEHPERGLSDNLVWAIFEDDQNQLWAGTISGLNRVDRATGQVTHFFNDPSDPNSLVYNDVRAIHQARDGALWIGTILGLSRYDPQTETFTNYRSDPEAPNSLSHPSVVSILEDDDGMLWLGTGGGGLNRLDPRTGQFVSFVYHQGDALPTTLGQNVVTMVADGGDGRFWLGSYAGLAHFDPATSQFRYYHHDPNDPASLSDEAVFELFRDSQDRLWVGTSNGLNLYHPETDSFTRYTERDGLPNNFIYGILEDDNGRLWISTNRGLTRFDPESETFRSYDRGDGLQGLEFNAWARFENSRGEMFFGGLNGLNYFRPEDIYDNPYVPPVVVTDLRILNESVAPGAESILQQPILQTETITLPRQDNVFTFELAGLHYAAPQSNQYAYILEGFDEEWNYLGHRRFATYTNLPPGSYTFRAVGSNSDGVWNTTGTTIALTIPKPFWQEPAFIAMLLLLGVGSIYAGYRLRVRSVESRNRELEAQVSARTAEIEARRQELAALYRADERMHRHLQLSQVLQALVDVAVDILHADKSSVLLWNAEQQQWQMLVARGFSPESMQVLRFGPSEGIIGKVTQNGTAVVVANAPRDVRRANEDPEKVTAVLREGVASFMHLPITIDGEVFGIFNVCFTTPYDFTEDDQRLFTSLAKRAALHIENAQLYESAQELAAASERNRLARDLHDAVTQTLFSASLIAEALPALWEMDPDEGKGLLQELRQLTRGALAEMRTLLLELRPASLEEAELDELFHQLAEAATGRTGIPITVLVDATCDLPVNVHVTLYRIAQEALNNIVKHARATRAAITLRGCGDGTAVRLTISDDGRGFDPTAVSAEHMGLAIIRERAQAVGAELAISSSPGEGTRVLVSWQARLAPESISSEGIEA